MLRGITVGCGFFGKLQLSSWRRVENVDIVAVVDRDEEKVKESASRFGLTGYADLAQAIEETSPDFVDVVTRPDSQRSVLIHRSPERFAPVGSPELVIKD